MLLPALVFLALAAFLAAVLGIPLAGRAAGAHLALAAGAMPLIFAAMSHFIPVLTRTRAAPAALAGVPLLGATGGALAVAAIGLPDALWAQHAGALFALVAASALLIWSRLRRAGMLGRPHACLAWYEAALACLIVALLAILASAVWPAQTLALRRLHLHLNTLGFIGMTALGTLAVLLPTVIGRPDPEAATHLRRGLPWAAGGTVLVAAGAAWFAPLAALGAAAWAVPLARMGHAWQRRYRAELFAAHGAAPLLGAAFMGLVVSLLLGAAAVVVPTLNPLAAFVAGFLFPLVSGAATQLLPVWLRPGVQDAWHAALRGRLGRHAGLRALSFGLAGVLAGTGYAWALWLAAAALAWFLAHAGIPHERHPS
ncbi:MAG: hypothetical protein AB1720_09405 [Pseudomonadota bacterium]